MAHKLKPVIKPQSADSASPIAAFRDGRQPKLAFDPSDERIMEARIKEQFQNVGPSMATIEFKTIPEAEHPYSASINPDGWNGYFSIREGLAFPNRPKLLNYLERRNIIDPLTTMVDDLTSHEIGHWEYPRGSNFGCPFDKPTLYETFIETAYEELKASGKFSDGFCKDYSFRAANVVTDTINNWNVAVNKNASGQGYSGMMLFLYLQGVESERMVAELLDAASTRGEDPAEAARELVRKGLLDQSGNAKFGPEYEILHV